MLTQDVATTEALRLIEARQLAGSGAGKMIREASGLTGAEFARAIDIDSSTLHRWETGSRRPTGAFALRYIDFLDLLRSGGR
jgi:DNA-binding transcriptional regulator YiaG